MIMQSQVAPAPVPTVPQRKKRHWSRLLKRIALSALMVLLRVPRPRDERREDHDGSHRHGTRSEVQEHDFEPGDAAQIGFRTGDGRRG